MTYVQGWIQDFLVGSDLKYWQIMDLEIFTKKLSYLCAWQKQVLLAQNTWSGQIHIHETYFLKFLKDNRLTHLPNERQNKIYWSKDTSEIQAHAGLESFDTGWFWSIYLNKTVELY